MGLYYEVHGSGRPVVLIHSGAMDSRDWNFITPKLANSKSSYTMYVEPEGPQFQKHQLTMLGT